MSAEWARAAVARRLSAASAAQPAVARSWLTSVTTWASKATDPLCAGAAAGAVEAGIVEAGIVEAGVVTGTGAGALVVGAGPATLLDSPSARKPSDGPDRTTAGPPQPRANPSTTSAVRPARRGDARRLCRPALVTDRT